MINKKRIERNKDHGTRQSREHVVLPIVSQVYVMRNVKAWRLVCILKGVIIEQRRDHNTYRPTGKEASEPTHRKRRTGEMLLAQPSNRCLTCRRSPRTISHPDGSVPIDIARVVRTRNRPQMLTEHKRSLDEVVMRTMAVRAFATNTSSRRTARPGGER